MEQSADRSAVGRRALPWLGLAALAIAVIGLIDIATSSEPRPDDARVPPVLTGPEMVACAHNIVVGEVRSAEKPGRRQNAVEVTIDTSVWLKSGSPRRHTFRFTTLAPWYSGEPPLRSGERVLVVEWSYPYDKATRVFRAHERHGTPPLDNVRAQIERDLVDARHTRCPAFWSDPERYHADVPDDA